jgi:hypothetical protein
MDPIVQYLTTVQWGATGEHTVSKEKPTGDASAAATIEEGPPLSLKRAFVGHFRAEAGTEPERFH